MGEDLDMVVDRLATDTDFREGFRDDPSMALASLGIEVPEEAVDELGDVSSATDVELEERVSKWWLVWHGGW